MKKTEFSFTDEQRKKLLKCWRRPREREIATLYLQGAERWIRYWQEEGYPDKSKAIKQQIELANNLRMNVEKTPSLLDNLPKDFEKMLATVWLQHKYGEAYFQQHSEACRKDAANNTVRRMMAFAALQGLAPAGAEELSPIETELSKLPPDYFQQTKTKLPPDYFQQAKTDADFLRIVASAANELTFRSSL